jgi:cytochrome P450
VARETKGDREEGGSMFHHLLRSDIPDAEKSTERLNAEAVSFLGAGTYPTAATTIFVAYYILAEPKIEERLREDLKDVMANFDEEVRLVMLDMVNSELTFSRYQTLQN